MNSICILKWVCSNIVQNQIRLLKTPLQAYGLFYFARNPRLYRTKGTENEGSFDEISLASGENVSKRGVATRRKAQAALLEYLHSTRNLQFIDAEHMSKNSPYFLEKILKKVEKEANIGQSMARFFRYHPINEFEPFFESLGLKPCEFSPMLPRNLMFLCDDDLLLENYHVLCNFGFERNKIGKIYKKVTEVFRYDVGVLPSKLQAFEKLGLSKSFIREAIVYCPNLLIGDTHLEFVKVLEILKSMEIEFSWIKEHLSDQHSYNWRTMFSFVSLCHKIGCSEEQLGRLIRQHPTLLFEGSGDRALTLFGFLLKFGTSINEVHSILLQFPQIEVGKFFENLRHCVIFLNEIEMDVKEIGNIVRTHPLLLGSCALKKGTSLLTMLNVGKKRLCAYIQENPQEMKKWVMGSKVEPFPTLRKTEEESQMKTKFLLEMGFLENSKKLEKALKNLRVRAEELHERFDCIVKAGIDRKDVCKMIRVTPLVLKQKKAVIEKKIDFLVNDLDYPISSLISFPQYLMYGVKRIKRRVLMYDWLKDQRAVQPKLTLTTLVTCTDELFVARYVDRHPEGPEVWKNLKRKNIVSRKYQSIS